MSRDSKLTVRLSDDERDALKELAHRCRVTESEMARKLLNDNMVRVFDDLRLLDQRFDKLHARLDELLKYSLASVGTCTQLYGVGLDNLGDEERKREVRKFVNRAFKDGLWVGRQKFNDGD
jgi:hypothetical protein